MSADTPRSRIDWNGEGNEREVGRILKSRNLIRKAATPAAIGFVGLALVGALAAGPVMRSLTATDAPTVEVASVRTASVTPTTTETPVAQPTPAAMEPVADAAPVTSTAARMTSATASPGLAANDPRWSADALAVDEDKLAELKKAVDETVAAAEIASAMGSDGTDGLFTSTIPAQAAGFAPERPATSARERSAFDAALNSREEAQPEPAVATASDLQPAKATQYVNMRSAPADDASVLAVVPANAAIEAETDCRWCEVNYDGQKGYIFQSFIAR